MKFKHYIAGCVLAVSALAACSHDGEDLVEIAPDQMRIECGISSAMTRTQPLATDAAMTTFAVGDRVAVRASTPTIQNQPWVNLILNEGSSVWTAEGTKHVMWLAATQHIDGYYPVAEGVSFIDFTLPVQQTAPAEVAAADYMKVSAEVAKTEQNDPVTLNFERQTALVRLELVWGDEFKNEAVKPSLADLKIYSPYASIVNDAKSGAPVAISPTIGETTVEALVIPSAEAVADQPFITVTLNGKAMTLKGIPAMEAGTRQIFTLQLGRAAIKLMNVVVEDWTEGSMNGGELDDTMIQPFVDPVSHTVELRKPGTLTEYSIRKAMGDSDTLVLKGEFNRDDFNTFVVASSRMGYRTVSLEHVVPAAGVKASELDFSYLMLDQITLPAWMEVLPLMENSSVRSVKALGDVRCLRAHTFTECYNLTELVLTEMTHLPLFEFDQQEDVGVFTPNIFDVENGDLPLSVVVKDSRICQALKCYNIYSQNNSVHFPRTFPNGSLNDTWDTEFKTPGLNSDDPLYTVKMDLSNQVLYCRFKETPATAPQLNGFKQSALPAIQSYYPFETTNREIDDIFGYDPNLDPFKQFKSTDESVNNIQGIVLPLSVFMLNHSALFANLKWADEIVLSEGLQYINGVNCFAGCSLWSPYLPELIDMMSGNNMFQNCNKPYNGSRYGAIYFPRYLKQIDGSNLYNNQNIEEIEICCDANWKNSQGVFGDSPALKTVKIMCNTAIPAQVFNGLPTANADLVLYKGHAVKSSGNSWNGMTWKSITIVNQYGEKI